MINSLRYLCCCVRYSERDLSRARLYSVCDVISDSESSTEEVIYTSQEMKSVTSDLAIKDIMGRDNDNKETSVIIENYNDGKLFWLHQNVNYNSLEKYLCLTFPQPLNLNCITKAGIREETVEPEPNSQWWLLFSHQICDFEYKFETFILQALRHFKFNHPTDLSSYREDGETPAVFLSFSLLGYVISESIDINEN